MPDHPDRSPGRIRVGKRFRAGRKHILDLAHVGVESGQLDDVRESRALPGKCFCQAREEVVRSARDAAHEDEFPAAED